MTMKTQCPDHILSASIDEKMLYYYRDVIVDHPLQNAVLDRLDQGAYPLLDRRLMLLVGGTGAGKTAVLRQLCMRRLLNKADAVASNPQIIPAIKIEIRAPTKGKFDFSTLYVSALREMNSALIERTLPLVERRAGQHSIATIGVEYAYQGVQPQSLEDRFANALIDREIEVACFDEAVNIFKLGSTRSDRERKFRLQDQSDKLKTFVNTTSTALILAGGYDFFELTLTTGQIARRSLVVHFEPYTMSPESLKGFANALIALLSFLPIEHDLDPNIIATELFLQCLGCIGTLKNILLAALLLALRAGKPLTMNFVRLSYYTAAQLKVMSDEMENGMKCIREFMSPMEMAKNAEQSAAGQRKKILAVGETTPSHRRDVADGQTQ
jgi:hypothetical protein